MPIGPEELLYASLPTSTSIKMIVEQQQQQQQDNLSLKRNLSQSYTKLAPNHKNVPVIDDFDCTQPQDSFNHRPRTRTKTISRQNSK